MLVLKFGGTSVGRIDRLVKIGEIIKHSLASSRAIIVVSAMSGKTKKEGTTSKLLAALGFSENGDITADEVDMMREIVNNMVDVDYNGEINGKDIDAIKNVISFLKGFSLGLQHKIYNQI